MVIWGVSGSTQKCILSVSKGSMSTFWRLGFPGFLLLISRALNHNGNVDGDVNGDGGDEGGEADTELGFDGGGDDGDGDSEKIGNDGSATTAMTP